MIHRDLKAQNIIIHDDGKLLLCDFGIADYIKKGESKTLFCGSPCWMAPEVIDQKVGYDQ